MPLVYACSNCGRPLEIFVGSGSRGPPSLHDVVSKHGYRCPYCGAELVADPMRLKVRLSTVSEVAKKLERGDYDDDPVKKEMLQQAIDKLKRYLRSRAIKRKLKSKR